MEREKHEQSKGIQDIDKVPLFCNQMTVSHSATEFFVDFRLVFPQFAPDNSQTTVALHKTVIFEPYHLKEVCRVIQDNISRYEKEYGKIKEPEALKKAKKRVEKKGFHISAPEYMG